MIKRYSTIVLIVALLLSITPVSTTTAANNVKVKSVAVEFNFDGKVLQPPAGQFVFIYKGTTYVPLRFVSYALLKNVEWDSKSSKVTVSEPTSSQVVSIKEKLMNSLISSNDIGVGKVFTMTPVKVNYVFNGEKKVLPSGQQSFIYKGSLYVPVRFMAIASGTEITWDGKSKTVKGISLSYKEQQANKPQSGQNSSGNNTASSSNSSENITTPPSSGGTGASNNNVSYETITSTTEAKLQALQEESKSSLLNLATQYLSASDETTKKKLLAEGQQQLDRITARFENIVDNAEDQLKASGYSTDIITQYRKAFNDEIEAGKQLTSGLAG
ncbi:copper amine oxidase N-terminal domain-containing protein [Paenibacillus polygoni]|uniref:Copper amine oxidase N-terminal domain-containing protein n=1 Tax=Paenibacillus polygoni TaxID=3050112 RepID=A0ABY8X7R5_9BACL|nr:copper amine oxidase N-terminal domain-containing protein [Paenibacillus polygoni]WIV20004.1 copper amine oxidase N-terminal domain-containing protein [Paenibacillus polygoni]